MVTVWRDDSNAHTTTGVSKLIPIISGAQEFTPAPLEQLNQGSRKDTLHGMVSVWEPEQYCPGQIDTEDSTGDGSLVNNANKTTTAAGMGMENLVLPLNYDDEDAETKHTSSWDVTSHAYLVDPCLVRKEHAIARSGVLCSSNNIIMTQDDSIAGNQRADSAFGDWGMISPDVNTLTQSARLDSALGDSDNASTPDAKSEEMNNAFVLDSFGENLGSAKEAIVDEALLLRQSRGDSEYPNMGPKKNNTIGNYNLQEDDSLNHSSQTSVDKELQREQPVTENCTVDVRHTLLNESQKSAAAEDAEVPEHIQLVHESGCSSTDHDVLDSWLDDTDHKQYDSETSVDDITTPSPDKNENDENSIYSPHWPLETILEASLEPNQRPDSLFVSASSQETAASFGSMNTEQDAMESQRSDRINGSVVTVGTVAGSSETEFTVPSSEFRAPLLQATSTKVDESLDSGVQTLNILNRNSEMEEFSLDSIDQMVQNATTHQQGEVNVEGKPGSEIEDKSTEPHEQRDDMSNISEFDKAVLQNTTDYSTDEFAAETPIAKVTTDDLAGDKLAASVTMNVVTGDTRPASGSTIDFVEDTLPADEFTDDISRETSSANESTDQCATDAFTGDMLRIKATRDETSGDKLPDNESADEFTENQLPSRKVLDELVRDPLAAKEFRDTFVRDQLHFKEPSDKSTGHTTSDNETLDTFFREAPPESESTEESSGDMLTLTMDAFDGDTLPAKITSDESAGDTLPVKETADEFGADFISAKVTTDDVLGDTLSAQVNTDMFAGDAHFVEDTSTAKESTDEFTEDIPAVREDIDDNSEDTLPIKQFVEESAGEALPAEESMDEFSGDAPPAREATEEFPGYTQALLMDKFGGDTLPIRATSDESTGDAVPARVTTGEFGSDILPAKVNTFEFVDEALSAELITDRLAGDPVSSNEFRDDFVEDRLTAKESTDKFTDHAPTIRETIDEFVEDKLPVEEYVDKFAGVTPPVRVTMDEPSGNTLPSKELTDDFAKGTPNAQESATELVEGIDTFREAIDPFAQDALSAEESQDEFSGDTVPAQDSFVEDTLTVNEFIDELAGGSAKESADELAGDASTIAKSVDDLVGNILQVSKSNQNSTTSWQGPQNVTDTEPIPDDQLLTNVIEPDRGDGTEGSCEPSHQGEDSSEGQALLNKNILQEKDEVNNDVFVSEHIDESVLGPTTEETESVYHSDSVNTVNEATDETDDAQKNRAYDVNPAPTNIEQVVMTAAVSDNLSPYMAVQTAGQKGNEQSDAYSLETSNDVKSDYCNEYSGSDLVLFEPDREAEILSEVAAALNTERVKVEGNVLESPAGENSHCPFDYVNAYGSANDQIILGPCSEGTEAIHYDESMEYSRVEMREPNNHESPEADNMSVNLLDDFGGKTIGEETTSESINMKSPQIEAVELRNDKIPDGGDKLVGLDEYVNEYSGIPPLEFREDRDSAIIAEVASTLLRTSPSHGLQDNDSKMVSSDAFDYTNEYAPLSTIPMKSGEIPNTPFEDETQNNVASLSDETIGVESMKQDLHTTNDEHPFDYTNMYAGTDPVKFEANRNAQIHAAVLSALNAADSGSTTDQEISRSVAGVEKAFDYINEYANACADNGSSAESDANVDERAASLPLQDPVLTLVSYEAEPDVACTALTSQNRDLATSDYVNEYSGIIPVDFESDRDHSIVTSVADTMQFDDHKHKHKTGVDDSPFDYINTYARPDLITSETEQPTFSGSASKYVDTEVTCTEANEDAAFDYKNNYGGSTPIDFGNSQDFDIEKDVRASLEIENSRPGKHQQPETKPITSFDYVNEYTSVILDDAESYLQHDLHRTPAETSEVPLKEKRSQGSHSRDSHEPQKRNKREIADISDYTNEYCGTNPLEFASDRDYAIVAEVARTINATGETEILRKNAQEEHRAHPFDCFNEYATGSPDIPGYRLTAEEGESLQKSLETSRSVSEIQAEDNAELERNALEVPSNINGFPVFDYVNDYSDSHPLDFQQGRDSAISDAVQEALSANAQKPDGSGGAPSDACTANGAFDYVNEYSGAEKDQVLVQQEGDDMGTGSHAPVPSLVPTHSAQPKLDRSAEEIHKGARSVADIESNVSASQDKAGSLSVSPADGVSIVNDPQNHDTSLFANKQSTEAVLSGGTRNLTFGDVQNAETDVEILKKQRENPAGAVTVPLESTSEVYSSLPDDLVDTKESNEFDDDGHEPVSDFGDHHSLEQFGIPGSESWQEFEDNQIETVTEAHIHSVAAGSLGAESHGGSFLPEASTERASGNAAKNATSDDLKDGEVDEEMQEYAAPVDYINPYSQTSPLEFEHNREDFIVSDVIRSLKAETGKVQVADDLYENASKPFDYVNEYASASRRPLESQESLEIGSDSGAETTQLTKHEPSFAHDEQLNRSTEVGQSDEEPPPFEYVNVYSGTQLVDFEGDREAAIGADVVATLSSAASQTRYDDSALHRPFDCVNEYASGQPHASDHHLETELDDGQGSVLNILGSTSELHAVDPEQAQGGKIESFPDTCESRPFDYVNGYHGTSPVMFEQDSDHAIIRAVCASLDRENKKSELEGIGLDWDAPNQSAFNYVNPYTQSQHSGPQGDEMYVHSAVNSQALAPDSDQRPSTMRYSDQMHEACEDTTEGRSFSDVDHDAFSNTTPNTENPVFNIPSRDDQSRSPSAADQERIDRVIPGEVHDTASSELIPSAGSSESQHAPWTFIDSESNKMRGSDDCDDNYANEYCGSTPVNFEKNREEVISADVSATMRAGSLDTELAGQTGGGLQPFDYINAYTTDGSGREENEEASHLTSEKDDTFQQTRNPSDVTAQNTWTLHETLKEKEKYTDFDSSRVIASAPLDEPEKPENWHLTAPASEMPMCDVSHPGASEDQPVLGEVEERLVDTSNGGSEDLPDQPTEGTDVVRVDKPELYTPIDHVDVLSKNQSTLLETSTLTDAEDLPWETGYQSAQKQQEQPSSPDLVTNSTMPSGDLLELQQQTLLVNNLTAAAKPLRKSDSCGSKEASRDDRRHGESLMGETARPGFDYVNDYCGVDPVSFENGRESLIAADVAVSLREETPLRHQYDDRLPVGPEKQHPFDYTNEYAVEHCKDSHVCTAAAVTDNATLFPTSENHEATESGPSAGLKLNNVAEDLQGAQTAYQQDLISTSIGDATSREEQEEENRLQDPNIDARTRTSGVVETEESIRMEAEENNSEFDIEQASFEKETVPRYNLMSNSLDADGNTMIKTPTAEALNTIHSHVAAPSNSQRLDGAEHDPEDESIFALNDDDYYEEFRLQQPRGESMPVEGTYDTDKQMMELSVDELGYPRTAVCGETFNAGQSPQIREKRKDHLRDEPRPASSIFGTPPEENPYIRSMDERISAEAWPTKRSTDDDPDNSVGGYEFFGSYSPNKEEAGDVTLSQPDVIPEIRSADTAKQIEDLEFRRGHEGSEADSEEFQGAEDGAWGTCMVGGEQHKIDMKVIEPYKKVVSHGGFMDGTPEQVIIVFAACHLPARTHPDYHYVMDNLFLYVLSTLDELVPEEYVIVYLHGAADGTSSPSFSWLRRCYQLVDRRLRKSLQKLYLVHPSFWLRALVALTRPFVSAKFSRKLQYVEGLRELSDLVPMNHVTIPGTVKQLDFQLMIAERKRQLNIK